LFLQKSIKQFKLKILDEQIFLMFFVWMFLFIYSLISPLICTNPIVKQKSGKNIFVSKDVFLLMNLQYSFYSYVSFIWFMYHKIMGFPNERAGIFYAKLNEFRKKERTKERKEWTCILFLTILQWHFNHGISYNHWK